MRSVIAGASLQERFPMIFEQFWRKKCLRYQIFCHNDNFFRRSNNFRIKIPAYQPRNARNTDTSSQKRIKLPFFPPSFSSHRFLASISEHADSNRQGELVLFFFFSLPLPQLSVPPPRSSHHRQSGDIGTLFSPPSLSRNSSPEFRRI